MLAWVQRRRRELVELEICWWILEPWSFLLSTDQFASTDYKFHGTGPTFELTFPCFFLNNTKENEAHSAQQASREI